MNRTTYTTTQTAAPNAQAAAVITLDKPTVSGQAKRLKSALKRLHGLDIGQEESLNLTALMHQFENHHAMLKAVRGSTPAADRGAAHTALRGLDADALYKAYTEIKPLPLIEDLVWAREVNGDPALIRRIEARVQEAADHIIAIHHAASRLAARPGAVPDSHAMRGVVISGAAYMLADFPAPWKHLAPRLGKTGPTEDPGLLPSVRRAFYERMRTAVEPHLSSTRWSLSAGTDGLCLSWENEWTMRMYYVTLARQNGRLRFAAEERTEGEGIDEHRRCERTVAERGIGVFDTIVDAIEAIVEDRNGNFLGTPRAGGIAPAAMSEALAAIEATIPGHDPLPPAEDIAAPAPTASTRPGGHQPEWTGEDDAAASREGWCLSETTDERYPYELQRIDSPEDEDGEMGEPLFASDQKAWEHVVARSRAGDDRAKRALRFLAAESPAEFERIATHTGIHDLGAMI